MWFWNRDNFEALTQVAELAEERGLPGLAEYCRLRIRGFRRQALDALRAFGAEQRARPGTEARAIADWIMCVQSDNLRADLLLAQPLWPVFLGPVFEEWRRESDSTIPRRWLAIYADDAESLREVLALDPADVRARLALISRLLRNVDHATQHLVRGHFAGSEDDALADLEEVARHISGLPPGEARSEAEEARALLKRLVSDWQEFKGEASWDFCGWCESHGRGHVSLGIHCGERWGGCPLPDPATPGPAQDPITGPRRRHPPP